MGTTVMGSQPVVPSLETANLAMASAEMDLTEKYLARRAQKLLPAKQEVKYEFTQDPGLLHQFYKLREEMFISVWGLKHFTGGEDAFDHSSHIIVARLGKQVIGGTRLTISSPAAPQALPMEHDDFKLSELFPDLGLVNRSYCEFSRAAILPDYQSGPVMPIGFAKAIQRAIAEGVDYAFTLSPIPMARNYRQTMQAFGFGWNIRSDIKIPERESFEGIRMVLSVMDLSKSKGASAVALKPVEHVFETSES